MNGSDAKICSACKELVPIDGYYFRSNAKDFRQSFCKTCHKNSTRQWQKQNRRKASDYKRAHRYSISASDVAHFLAIPSCQSCGSGFTSDHSVKLDHCHCNGHVRGAICHACNLAVSGSAEEALLRLDSCRAYLLRDLEWRNEQG